MKKLVIGLLIVLLLVSGCGLLLPKPDLTDIPTKVGLPTENPTNTPELMPEPSETLAVESTEEPIVTEGEKERHFEEDAKFSYEPIEGWTFQAFPGLNTKILLPGADLINKGISLVFIREDYEGTTEDYALLGMENAKMDLEDFKIGKSSSFETLSGLTVLKHHATYKANDLDFDSIFYLIGDDARPELAKLVVTFASFPGVPEEVVDLVETLIKSIRFED